MAVEVARTGACIARIAALGCSSTAARSVWESDEAPREACSHRARTGRARCLVLEAFPGTEKERCFEDYPKAILF